METFTIEQIKNYLLSQDSMGDMLYNLKAENIAKANDKLALVEQLMEIREDWTVQDYLEAYEDEWEDIQDMSVDRLAERMEEDLTNKYETSYIAILIRDER